MATNFLALSLLAPAFAGAGLLLAGIPIIIHILNRRRYRTVDWAAMAFLLRAMRKNGKFHVARRRLRQLADGRIGSSRRPVAVENFALDPARPLGHVVEIVRGEGPGRVERSKVR